jgi:two-component system cell cycle sensor histidine kinase PleC
VITRAATTGALIALASALADPASAGLQALARHRLFAGGAVVLALASAVNLGMAIGRRKAAGGPFMARTIAPTQTGSDKTPAQDLARDDAMARAETEFLANMSHEMRTPLNAVIGFAELMLSEIHGPLGDRRYVDYIDHIRVGGQQLLAIVDATLDLSQLAAGRLGLELQRVEPQAIAEECLQSVAAQAEAAKVEVTMRPSIAPQVIADPDRLKQVLINLLTNAIKFTQPGGRVSIGASSQGDGIAFEVNDTGIGMTPDQIVLARQPFRMVDGSMTRAKSGIGLGLPLAERLVRLHGGELRIDSRPGCGTTVTAILPVGVEE